VAERIDDEDRAVTLGIWSVNGEAGCQALGSAGSFIVLTPEKRQVAAELPRDDVSWMVDEFGTLKLTSSRVIHEDECCARLS